MVDVDMYCYGKGEHGLVDIDAYYTQWVLNHASCHYRIND